MKKNGEDASELLAQAAAIPGELKALEDELEEIREKLHDLMLRVPNLPSPTTPIGKDETENVEVRRWGTPRTFDFPLRTMWMSVLRSVWTSIRQPNFPVRVLLSCAAKSLICTARSLSSCWMCIRVSKAIPKCYTPYIVTASTMTGTGQLPKFEEDLFAAKKGGAYSDLEQMYLVPTAEVTLTNSVSGQILKAADLPIFLTAHTPCFRSEAGAYGRDTRGMIRQHQFDKVEMVKIVRPEESLRSARKPDP